MAIDYTRSKWDDQEDYNLGVGSEFDEEGQLVISSLVAGVEVGVRGSAAASLQVMGFAMLTSVSPKLTRMYGTQGTIPSASPYTIDIGHTLITADINVLGDVQVQRDDTDAFLTLVVGAPATGEFRANNGLTTGVLTFNAAQAGVAVSIIARVDMTAREQLGLFQQRHINADSQPDMGKVGALMGQGVMFTDQFDPVITDWTAGPVTTGVGGVLSVGGAGTSLAAKMHVISVPTVEDPWLGVRFNMGQ